MITRFLRPALGLGLLVSGLALGGADVALPPMSGPKTIVPPTFDDPPAVSRSPAPAAPQVFYTPEMDDRQKLAVGDRISFRILEDKEDPKSLTVTDAGDLDVPYLGLHAVVGKTCRQAAGELKDQLESRFYYHAHVVVALESANRAGIGRRVYVTGQVRTPGPIDVPAGESTTVGQAVMRAGGFAEFADKRHVRIVRDGGAGREKNTITVNVLEVWQKGRTADDVVLEPNDLVYVPTRLINF